MERVPPAPIPEDVVRLAGRMPHGVHLGTSSWAYPGWRGLVYARRAPSASLARDGLAAYAEWPIFTTVGLDRAFYSSPTEDEYRVLADLVPSGFRFCVKADQRCVRPDADAHGSTLGSTTAHRAHGAPNPLFLDADFAWETAVRPAIRGLGERLGPVVFQFPYLDVARGGRFGGAAEASARIGGFLSALRVRAEAEGLHERWIPAIEVRNREFLSPAAIDAYVRALGEGDAVHAYLQHPTMPSPDMQERALAAAGAPAARREARAIVVRWMLPSATTYQDASAAFEPFDRMLAPDPAVRAEVAALLSGADSSRPGFVVCNNKAEGCAALTVRALAEELAQDGAATIAVHPETP